MAKRERASIAPERLGSALRGRDILIPGAPSPAPVESAPALSEPSESAPPEPAAAQLGLISKPANAESATAVEREPVTVRLTKPTLRRLARTRLEVMETSDLKVSQSDLIEAAIWALLEKPQEIEQNLRRLQAGMLFKSA